MIPTVAARGRRGRDDRPAAAAGRGGLPRAAATTDEVAAAIRDMAIRGAPAIGVAAALGIALGVRALARPRASPARASSTPSARSCAPRGPTAVNLFWAIDRMRRAFDARRGRRAGPTPARRAARGGARHPATRTSRPAGAWATSGAALLPTGVARAHPLQRGRAGHRRLRHRAGRHPLGGARRARCTRVFADETRPYLQGARLTAWELMQRRHPHHAHRRQHGRAT